jgi:hypothetical protein
VNCAGILTGLTSSAAPVSEMFLIVQEMTLPPNSILAPFSTRCRAANPMFVSHSFNLKEMP